MKCAEGGSVGRRVLASRHNESTINTDAIDQFSNEHNFQWSIKLHSNTLFVQIPEELCEGSKVK